MTGLVNRKPRPITCPKCGCDEVRFVEDVAVFYEIQGRNEAGQILVDTTSRSESEMGHNLRLACWDSGCMHTWPLSEDWSIEWVDGEGS
jgi:hypothetical protein